MFGGISSDGFIAYLLLSVLREIIVTSGQGILTKGSIEGGGRFLWGRDVTLTSLEHCSQLQQSCCCTIIED